MLFDIIIFFVLIIIINGVARKFALGCVFYKNHLRYVSSFSVWSQHYPSCSCFFLFWPNTPRFIWCMHMYVCVFSLQSTYLKIRRFLDDRRQLFCESTQQQPLALYMCVLVLELAKSRLAVFGSWSLLRVENRWQLLIYDDDTGVLINEIKKNSKLLLWSMEWWWWHLKALLLQIIPL